MALSLNQICGVVRDFYKSIPEDKIVAPIGLTDTIVPALERRLSAEGKASGVKVESRLWGSRHLKGMLLRYETSNGAPLILFSRELNACWSRFVVCKEVAHLLIDAKEKHFTHDPVELVQQLIAGAPSLNSDDEIHSERVAVIAAIEILAPWKLRPKIQELAKSGLSDHQIATFFRMPEAAVNYLLRSRYWSVSSECHEKIS